MATQTEQTQQSPKQLERKAAAKEEIVNATSGAREIVDHAAFNARAVGKILLHPFNKEAKQEAIATAREDKAASGEKMAAIREVGAQQADALRLSARGMVAPEGAQPGMWSPGAVQPGTFRDADAKLGTGGAAAPVVGDRENL
ncbi:hypothetical protein M758_12G093500 [Ceratodon purpureus]|nr:hypothetical protein M758_12G093500 [Ceratodon purpureus]